MHPENEILKELKELDSPLAGIERAMPYAVPEGYLEGLPDTLTRTATGTPAPPFEVPEGYFAALPGRLLEAAKAAGEPKPRVIDLSTGWQRKAVQWAAAAVLVLGLGLGTYRYLQPAPAAPEASLALQLAGLEADSIHVYLEQQVDELDMESLEAAVVSTRTDMPLTMSELDEGEIEQYLGEEAGLENLN